MGWISILDLEVSDKQLKQIEESISELYRKVLQREPDERGLVHFSNQVIQGKMTLESVKHVMLESPEYVEIDPRFDFSNTGEILKGFFDDYKVFQKSSKTATSLNILNWRYKAIIESNKDLIGNSSILDIASHDGRWTFAALKNNAKFVLGIEAREHLVKNANQNLTSLGIPKEKFEFRLGDANEEITRIPRNSFDAIFCLGFFYHTINHWKILSEIKRINPKYLILDTAVSTLSGNVIEVNFEDPEHEANAFFQNDHKSSFVGKPTKGAVELMLNGLGFETKIIDWHKLGIQNWRNLVTYYKKERMTFVAINQDR